MNRLKCLAIEVYKCVKGKNPNYMNDMFKSKNSLYNFRDPSKLDQSKFKTVRFGYKSFSYYGSKLWNSLPPDIKNAENVFSFKKKLSLWCQTPDARSLVIV